MSGEASVSPSRTYIIPCRRLRREGWYFRKFTLPFEISEKDNNNQFATHYFLNNLDLTAAVATAYTFEDFCDVSEAQEP